MFHVLFIPVIIITCQFIKRFSNLSVNAHLFFSHVLQNHPIRSITPSTYVHSSHFLHHSYLRSHVFGGIYTNSYINLDLSLVQVRFSLFLSLTFHPLQTKGCWKYRCVFVPGQGRRKHLNIDAPLCFEICKRNLYGSPSVLCFVEGCNSFLG